MLMAYKSTSTPPRSQRPLAARRDGWPETRRLGDDQSRAVGLPYQITGLSAGLSHPLDFVQQRILEGRRRKACSKEPLWWPLANRRTTPTHHLRERGQNIDAQYSVLLHDEFRTALIF